MPTEMSVRGQVSCQLLFPMASVGGVELSVTVIVSPDCVTNQARKFSKHTGTNKVISTVFRKGINHKHSIRKNYTAPPGIN